MSTARTIRLICGVALPGAAIIAALATPAAADVKKGVDAWSEGNFDTAVNEWRLPAQSGDADALFNLAQAYRLGRGVTADIARARELYAEAAKKGHVQAADNYGLLLFQEGERKKAMPLIRAAADRGDPRAQYILGLSHFNADYAEKDWVRAYALLTLSQSAGLPQAKAALAQMDEFIPMQQRQQAQLLAREIEVEAGKRRAAELAAIELAKNSDESASPAMANTNPAPTLASLAPMPTTRPVPVSSTPRQVVPVPATKPASKPAPKPAMRTGSWAVQLGAFGVRSNADRLWNKLSGNRALAGATKLVVPAGRVNRLMAGGFNSQAEAQKACSALKSQGHDCLVAKR